MRIYPPKEAHKRKLVPDRSNYTGYITCRDDKWYYRDNNNKNIFEFSSEKECKLHCNIISEVLQNIYSRLYNEYTSHKSDYPEYYRDTYEEANMTLRFYYRGFDSYTYTAIADNFVDNAFIGFKGMTWKEQLINPNHNWFGISVYEPDVIFVRGDKTIHLSLNGMSMPFPEDNQEYNKLMDMINAGGLAKYICFKDGDNVVYRTWYGNLPNDELIENFTKE